MLSESSSSTAAYGRPVRVSKSDTWAIINIAIATSAKRMAASASR